MGVAFPPLLPADAALEAQMINKRTIAGFFISTTLAKHLAHTVLEARTCSGGPAAEVTLCRVRPIRLFVVDGESSGGAYRADHKRSSRISA